MRKLIGNFLYVFLAQGAVLLISILLNLFVPKIIGKAEFGYWQFFLLLTSYIGFFTLGFSDGYFVKQSGKPYQNLDFAIIKKEFQLFILMQLCFSAIILLSAFLYSDKKILLLVLSFYLIFQNTSNFFGFVFQSAGFFKKYSYSVLIDKLFFLLALLFLYIIKPASYLPFIVLFTIGKAFSTLYCFVNAREFAKFSIIPKKQSITSNSDFKDTLRAGVPIMLSNILNGIIIGAGRFMIEHRWGIEMFGEVSLSFSFAFFFLLFVSQIGMVLFPMLKTLDKDKTNHFFLAMKQRLDILLPIILVLYYPARIFLENWLPQYSNSIRYLIILLPLCLYEGKFHILYLVFFKAERKERQLLIVNISILVISIILCGLSAYVFNSLILVLLSLIAAIIIRSLYSEYLLSSNRFSFLDDLTELLLVISFIYLNWYLGKNSIFFFGIALLIYYILNMSKLKTLTFNKRKIKYL